MAAKASSNEAEQEEEEEEMGSARWEEGAEESKARESMFVFLLRSSSPKRPTMASFWRLAAGGEREEDEGDIDDRDDEDCDLAEEEKTEGSPGACGLVRVLCRVL